MAQRGWGTGRGLVTQPSPLTDLPVSCFLPRTPREVLGLVNVVALENGELGSLLSPGTVRGLEDECVTDVKVPETWYWRFGRERAVLCKKGGVTLGLGGLSPPPFTISTSLFSLWTSVQGT